ncbi:MAG: GGDEF domain-containing protein, partial [Bdellovibrionales bacterium]|nr:GGDEF domain-containing protein [Massilia sp.]
MATTPAKPPVPGAPDNAAEFAREAFRRLATRRIAPTPQNYLIIYNEVAGIVEPPASAPDQASPAEEMLASFAAKLIATPGELHDFGRRFARALKAGDFETYGRNLSVLVEKHFRK